MAADEMKVPDPVTLRDAIREGILQNREVGYFPGRSIQLTENGEADDQVFRCQNLVNDPATFDILTGRSIARLWGVQMQDELAVAAADTDVRGFQQMCEPGRGPKGGEPMPANGKSSLGEFPSG